MMDQLQELKTKLGTVQTVLLTMPANPSQDVVASTLALYLSLKNSGKTVTIATSTLPIVRDSHLVGLDKITTEVGGNNLVITLDVPENQIDKVTSNTEGGHLNLIVNPAKDANPITSENVKFSYSGAAADLVIVVGAADLADVGALAEKENELFAKERIANVSNQVGSFGSINITDPSSSNSELVTALLKELALPMDIDIANNLMQGIEAATNGLSSPNMTADTFEALAVLYRTGARRQTPTIPVKEARIVADMPIVDNEASQGSELPKSSEPFNGWIVVTASEITIPNWQELGLNSNVAVVINLEKKMMVICGTWYGGEIKKGMFSVMNYTLPLKGVGAFHCSANIGKDGKTALFFGLSGTGKTTLSADPKRSLVGDDEHGWDDEGIFNFEGGCYAKVINLSEEKEPDIYKAINRDALLENVVIDKQGRVDFADASKTENTRVGYPIYHIKDIVKSGKGKHPSKIIFLTCDSFGVLPPVSKLSQEQAKYWYLSGYTAKVAGTERGITEPVAAFSSCFGGPFLTVHPTKYAQILGEKINQYGAQVYLVNTGWIKGGYGVGQRMDITATRQIVDKILDGSLEKAKYIELKPFGLMIPSKVEGVETELLNPRNGWTEKSEYDRTAIRLGQMFIDNFKTFTDTQEGKELEAVGPKI